MLWRNYRSFLLSCVHSGFSKHLQCRERGLNVWFSENHCLWGKGLWRLLPSTLQSPQGTQAVIREHPGALWIFGAMPLHYLCILLAVLKVLWKTDLHRHFAMQLPLKLVFQEAHNTFYKETFVFCYLPKGYGLHFLNNPQQRRCNQSWPDPTEWHVEIQLSAAKSEVCQENKGKNNYTFNVFMLSLEHKAGLLKVLLARLSWEPALSPLPGPGHSVRQFCSWQAHGQGHRSPAPASCLLPAACGSPSVERKEQPGKKVNPYEEQPASAWSVWNTEKERVHTETGLLLWETTVNEASSANADIPLTSHWCVLCNGHTDCCVSLSEVNTDSSTKALGFCLLII